ncbi:hypothetical protein EV356DRAFT_509734 [Viridothelium virens]|uniref:Uncharacterized protein n=1 Tax=Viridothelium virens TaxID=1048519 RepID=A0A6A6HK51_VIRVR|nr:hypothetical protein EV356DRAFT_509734 [Viridothelium virens]
MIYIPAGDLKYTKGKDHLTSYQFGSKQGNHRRLSLVPRNRHLARRRSFASPFSGPFRAFQQSNEETNYVGLVFCPTCGTSTVGDLEGIIPGISHAVNVSAITHVHCTSKLLLSSCTSKCRHLPPDIHLTCA